MMGQQQETVAGSALRRMIMTLAVALVMAAMVLATTAPAFAKIDREGFFKCILFVDAQPGFSHGEAVRECSPPGQP
jgi:hypothetical protein